MLEWWEEAVIWDKGWWEFPFYYKWWNEWLKSNSIDFSVILVCTALKWKGSVSYLKGGNCLNICLKAEKNQQNVCDIADYWTFQTPTN
jgi:hypothetical protein